MPGAQRIDEGLVFGARKLDQAQPGPVGLLAYEFGVDGDKVVPAEAGANLGELLRGFDEAHGRRGL